MTQAPMIMDTPVVGSASASGSASGVGIGVGIGIGIDHEVLKEKFKKKRNHIRALSLKDRINGLVQSASLRKIPTLGLSKSKSSDFKTDRLHKRTTSAKLAVFNDDDSFSPSDEEKDEEPEDSVIAI